MNAPVQRYKPWCPKCGSKALSIEHDPRARVTIVSCYICGWTAYGDEAIQALVTEQMGTVAKQNEKVREMLKKQPPVTKEVPAVVDAPLEEAVPGHPTCSWEDCTKPVRLSRGKLTKYCSRKCCVKNAHARDKARKAAKAKTNG